MKFDRFELHFKMFDLREMLSNLFNKMRIQAEFLSLNMHLKIAQSLPKFIYSDQERLERVIFVLLQNSLKYTRQGCIKLIAESNRNFRGRGVDEQDGMESIGIQFTVIDSGIGISHADQREMFKLFSHPRSTNH